MYRVVNHIPQTGKSLGELYYEKFATQYRAALQRKLKNRRTWSVGIFGHPNDKVEMKLLPGSKAETFIMHCIKRESFFRTLLYGDLSQMVYLLKIIDKWVGDDREMRRLSDQDKLRICQQQRIGAAPVCHFHSVVKRIFVDALYDEELDKDWVFRKRDLKYCPYCGDAAVFITEHNDACGNQVVSKTELDHYLPKSVFPFYAVNVYNLFPCCERCNAGEKKGAKVPIENGHDLIMYPHYFDEGRLSFVYVPSSAQHPDDDIELMCLDTYLEIGYKNILGLEALYKNYKGEARHMMENAREYLSLRAMQYGKQTYSFNNRFLHYYVKSTLGFDPEKDKPMEVQRHKFKMDIFRQINHQYNIQLGLRIKR